ncbi:MAG: MoaD/ThiS family protein [Spirochaetaceae bacterium]
MAAAELRFFGPLSEAVGTERETVEVPLPITPAALRARLTATYPPLEGRRFSIAVDARLLGNGDTIETVESAREIALLPPFGGG